MASPEILPVDDVATAIRNDATLAKTRLVLVASLSWKDDRSMVRGHGFEALVAKPVHRQELVATLVRVVRGMPSAPRLTTA